MASTYGEAGVDLVGADRHVANIAPIVTATWGSNIVGGFGGFAAGIELPEGMRRPVLMMSTDGVGTKLEIARATDSWTGVGFDLVAMCVDDLTAVGAKPLGFVDYMAVGSLRPERDTTVVASIATACAEVGCALVGGETAEHPGVMEPDAVDLAGAALGVVERGEEITGQTIESGDAVIGLRSPNLRSNGFSLVRSVFSDWSEQLGDGTVGDLALDPSVLYSPAVLTAMSTGAVRGAAHITGGGIPGNLGRPLPKGLTATVDSTSWIRPEIFDHIQKRAGLSDTAMFEAFNMGIGFCLITSQDDAEEVMAHVSGHTPVVIGEIVDGTDPIRVL